MDYALELRGISKSYKNFKLDNISFKVPKGCIMGFVGENGAGKTTTIKTILNLIHADKGNIRILGMDYMKDQLAIRNQIGVVFDESFFHENLTLLDISKIMKHIYSKWEDETFFRYANTFKLPKDKIVKEYSRGMKMKLSIAVALSHQAKLLILDEATSGLDPIVRDEILDIFLEFIQNEDHTIFISSHITSDLEKVADYITFIHEGSIILSESKDNLTDNYGVVKCKKEDFEKLDRNHIIGIRKNKFGYEVMIDNKREIIKQMNQKKYSNEFYLDNTTIEEIILFKVRGE